MEMSLKNEKHKCCRWTCGVEDPTRYSRED
jgi:hypothetical protein